MSDLVAALSGEASRVRAVLDKWEKLCAEYKALAESRGEELDRLRTACSRQDDEVCQTLGQALGYPWYKDDQVNFPGATEANGVCVGEHVAETLAVEAAREIVHLREIIATIGR